jgi:hypothetical protein
MSFRINGRYGVSLEYAMMFMKLNDISYFAIGF